MLSNIKKYGFIFSFAIVILSLATLFTLNASANFKAHADQRTYKTVTKNQATANNAVQAGDHDTDNVQSSATKNVQSSDITKNANQQGLQQIPTDESDSNIPNRDQYLLYGEVSITTTIDGAEGVPSSPDDNIMPAPSTVQHPINEGE